MYYGENGKLIFAEITHYRGALYSIYFHDDELLHKKIGSFNRTSEISINGDLAHVEAVIREDYRYAFVLDDLEICLEYAYE